MTTSDNKDQVRCVCYKTIHDLMKSQIDSDLLISRNAVKELVRATEKYAVNWFGAMSEVSEKEVFPTRRSFSQSQVDEKLQSWVEHAKQRELGMQQTGWVHMDLDHVSDELNDEEEVDC